MIKIRAIFEKKGRSKYISHLDLNRCMQRCFKRSGIPVWYTEGFNPHIYITFALPLSLGYESGVEIMDFNITEEMPFEEITERLNRAMPEGIRIREVYTPSSKHTGIHFADFRINLRGDVAGEFERFLSQERILTIKKTKRGEKEIDLKPDIKLVSAESGENTALVLRLPAGNEKNINPSLVTDLFVSFCGEKTEVLSVERVAILDGGEKDFR